MLQKYYCVNCGMRPKRKSAYYAPTNTYIFKRLCTTCFNYPFLFEKALQKTCSICNGEFHSSQLEVMHIDHNKYNDDYDNLQIVCCNCHRLDTYKNTDFTKKYRRSMRD